MPATPAITLSHIGLHCFDLAKMVDFYTGGMGLTETDRGEIPFQGATIEIVFLSGEITIRSRSWGASPGPCRSTGCCSIRSRPGSTPSHAAQSQGGGRAGGRRSVLAHQLLRTHSSADRHLPHGLPRGGTPVRAGRGGSRAHAAHRPEHGRAGGGDRRPRRRLRPPPPASTRFRSPRLPGAARWTSPRGSRPPATATSAATPKPPPSSAPRMSASSGCDACRRSAPGACS